LVDVSVSLLRLGLFRIGLFVTYSRVVRDSPLLDRFGMILF